MSLSRYKPVTRLPAEKIVLRNGQFSRWLAKRSGVSHKALSSALRLISQGVVEALGEGYNVNLSGLGVFETREMPARLRYHRLDKKTYISQPSTIVHFRKSTILTSQVRTISAQLLDIATTRPSVKPVN